MLLLETGNVPDPETGCSGLHETDISGVLLRNISYKSIS
jgi:hypothetical protein